MRKQRTWLSGVFAALVVTTMAAAAAAPPFVADRIETFDGKKWAGVTLGVTTQDGVKQQFKNGRGDFSTSVELKPESDAPFKVSALYLNRDKNATLDGIAIKYRNESDGLPLARLMDSLGSGEEFYLPGERYEDWKIIAYPQRGILLFALEDRVLLVLLGHPGRIADTLTILSKESAPVTEYQDPHKDEPRILRFGDMSVDFSLKGLDIDNRNRERREIERDIRNSSAGGALRYDPGESGSYKVDVTAKYNPDKGGDGTVSVSINGSAPYGSISVYRSESFKIDKGRDDLNLEDTRYYRALTNAMRAAEREAADKLRQQGPPPIESFRRTAWDQVFDKYRFHSTPADTGGSGKSGGLL